MASPSPSSSPSPLPPPHNGGQGKEKGKGKGKGKGLFQTPMDTQKLDARVRKLMERFKKELNEEEIYTCSTEESEGYDEQEDEDRSHENFKRWIRRLVDNLLYDSTREHMVKEEEWNKEKEELLHDLEKAKSDKKRCKRGLNKTLDVMLGCKDCKKKLQKYI